MDEDQYGKNDIVLTQDEWTEKYAMRLSKDIKCHIDNADDPVRYIMMSIRNWVEAGCICANAKISIIGKGGYACGACGKRRVNGKG